MPTRRSTPRCWSPSWARSPTRRARCASCAACSSPADASWSARSPSTRTSSSPARSSAARAPSASASSTATARRWATSRACAQPKGAWHLQLLAARVAGVELVPQADVGLPVDPAQVHLAAVAQRGEVDEAAVEVAQDDPALVELRDAGLERDERLADLPPGRPAAVAGRRAGERRARLLVGQQLARPAQERELLDDPRQLPARLVEGVVA